MTLNYNNQHTFDNYIVSECNKAAYAACRSIVDDVDGRFVALYGPSPCGKTHLLNAVKFAFQNKYLHVQYLPLHSRISFRNISEQLMRKGPLSFEDSFVVMI